MFQELFAARRSQAIIPSLAIVVRGSPKRGNPTPIFETVQCRVKRAVLDLQDLFRPLLDYVGDRVAVRWTRNQCLQDEQVQRALQHFAFERMSFSCRHLVFNYPIDDRLESVIVTKANFIGLNQIKGDS